LWVSAVAFGAVSFSIEPAPVAIGLSIMALLIAFGATLIPLRQGKIGLRSSDDCVLRDSPSA
ncbi:undecaprenyl-phosphate alpha-N-acetylglucosaminyl 1-phosphate transferase, partial [Corynebacterium sp. MSK158]|nr:undecaprenyl-phosphate alpha-N-acetylglucosaminyl 1-phosphate transferase [Corynebacterium sp. MSK158]